MYTFSIIIPHYNIPELLRRCLDSIPKRDDVQVVIVDDNSNPDIVAFDCFPGINQANIEIYFDKSGKGAGHARNIGLNHALGDWLLFADADDEFEPDFNNILELLKDDSISDLVNFEVTSRNSDDNQPNNEIDNIDYHCAKKEYLDNPSSFKYVVLTPWGKAIRRTLIDKYNIRFDEVKYGNDLLFSTLCDFYCQHRRILPIIGYCWKYRKDSLWHQKNLEWAVIRFDVLLRTGVIMRRLGDFSISERYLAESKNLLPIIGYYSKLKQIKSLLKYSIFTRNIRILLVSIPWTILLCIITKKAKHDTV